MRYCRKHKKVEATHYDDLAPEDKRYLCDKCAGDLYYSRVRNLVNYSECSIQYIEPCSVHKGEVAEYYDYKKHQFICEDCAEERYFERVEPEKFFDAHNRRYECYGIKRR